MAASRRVMDLAIGEEDLARLEIIARSRTDPASWVQRARILLAYRAEPSAYAVGEAIGVTHQTVLRCLDRAKRLGVMAALNDSPRPGKRGDITAEAKAWLTSLACQKAKDLGYPHELWTTRLLVRHAREHAVAAGHPCMAGIVQGTVCKTLSRHEVKPHKIRYYLERRDEAFETKMAEVLCVYREVAVLRAIDGDAGKIAIISYDEKPGVLAIGNTAPIYRQSRAFMRPSLATTNTSVMAVSVCWPGSTCRTARCTLASRTVIGRVGSSASSSVSTQPIPPAQPPN